MSKTENRKNLGYLGEESVDNLTCNEFSGLVKRYSRKK